MIALEKLTVRFGGIVALDAVSARLCAPVSGIIGPNGAGKTTTMNVISGFVSCSGAVTVDGTDLMQMPPHQRSRWGLRRSFQREQIADDLTVCQNLWAIADNLTGSRASKRADIEMALEFAASPASPRSWGQSRTPLNAACAIWPAASPAIRA